MYNGQEFGYQLANSIQEGNSAFAMVQNVAGDDHWIIIDGVFEQNGEQSYLFRDPGAGVSGYISRSTFDVTYFTKNNVVIF